MDKDGYLFVDRSGDAFRYILEYMRTGRLIQPKDSFKKAILLADLKFYNIQMDPQQKMLHGGKINWT